MMQSDDTQPAPAPDADGFGPANDELEQALARMAELEAQIVRERAEAENQRKRWVREFEQARKYGADRLLGELFPVIDSLEQGLKAAEVPGAGIDSLKQGIEMTLKMLQKAAESSGLHAIDPVGQAFNPEVHQAVGMQPHASVPADQVISVLQKGYRLHERLLRPAMVLVSQGAG